MSFFMADVCYLKKMTNVTETCLGWVPLPVTPNIARHNSMSRCDENVLKVARKMFVCRTNVTMLLKSRDKVTAKWNFSHLPYDAF